MEALNPNHWTAREVPNKKIEKKTVRMLILIVDTQIAVHIKIARIMK